MSTFGFHAQVGRLPALVAQDHHRLLGLTSGFSLSLHPLQAFWFPDVAILVGCIAVFMTLSYAVLHLYVKERR